MSTSCQRLWKGFGKVYTRRDRLMASRKVRSYSTEEVDLLSDFLSLSYTEGKEIVLSAYKKAFLKAKKTDDAILLKWLD